MFLYFKWLVDLSPPISANIRSKKKEGNAKAKDTNNLIFQLVTEKASITPELNPYYREYAISLGSSYKKVLRLSMSTGRKYYL